MASSNLFSLLSEDMDIAHQGKNISPQTIASCWEDIAETPAAEEKPAAEETPATETRKLKQRAAKKQFIELERPSHIDALRNGKVITAESRAQALEKLANPAASLAKTKMCRFVAMGQKCPHTECRYAHDRSELRKQECHFGKECNRFKSCRFFHPQRETEEDYNRRLRIATPTTAPKAALPKPVVMARPVVMAPEPDELVLRVPAVCVEAAVKATMEAGHTSFRVEIV